jgi:hypothetical protein
MQVDAAINGRQRLRNQSRSHAARPVSKPLVSPTIIDRP